jgi:hypothetical protein
LWRYETLKVVRIVMRFFEILPRLLTNETTSQGNTP